MALYFVRTDTPTVEVWSLNVDDMMYSFEQSFDSEAEAYDWYPNAFRFVKVEEIEVESWTSTPQ